MVDWSLALPQLRRMLFGPDYPADRLRPAIAEAARVLTDHFAAGNNRSGASGALTA